MATTMMSLRLEGDLMRAPEPMVMATSFSVSVWQICGDGGMGGGGRQTWGHRPWGLWDCGDIGDTNSGDKRTLRPWRHRGHQLWGHWDRGDIETMGILGHPQ